MTATTAEEGNGRDRHTTETDKTHTQANQADRDREREIDAPEPETGPEAEKRKGETTAAEAGDETTATEPTNATTEDPDPRRTTDTEADIPTKTCLTGMTAAETAHLEEREALRRRQEATTAIEGPSSPKREKKEVITIKRGRKE